MLLSFTQVTGGAAFCEGSSTCMNATHAIKNVLMAHTYAYKTLLWYTKMNICYAYMMKDSTDNPFEHHMLTLVS